MLESAGVFLITTIGGDAGKILAALLSNPFDARRFSVPNRGGRSNGGPPRGPGRAGFISANEDGQIDEQNMEDHKGGDITSVKRRSTGNK